MKGKIFTRTQANGMLVYLVKIAKDIKDLFPKVNDAIAAHEKEKSRARSKRLERVVSRRLDRLQRFISEIEDLGGVVKNYETAHIDFYGEVDGVIVYFCWELGEESVAFFHGVEEGCTQRREIPIVARG